MKKIFFFLIICFPLFSQEYKKPPEVISSMIEAEPQPTLNFNNNGDLDNIISIQQNTFILLYLMRNLC